MARSTVDMTIKVVDFRDRTITTTSYPAGKASDAERIGRNYMLAVKENWTHLDPDEVGGFYVWDDTGELLAYG